MAHPPRRPRIVIAVRRAERVAEERNPDLNQRDPRNRLSTCGPKKVPCVLVEEAEGTYGDRKIGETYVIAPT